MEGKGYQESNMEKQTFEHKSKDSSSISGDIFLHYDLKNYCEKRRDDSLILATIHKDI